MKVTIVKGSFMNDPYKKLWMEEIRLLLILTDNHMGSLSPFHNKEVQLQESNIAQVLIGSDENENQAIVMVTPGSGDAFDVIKKFMIPLISSKFSGLMLSEDELDDVTDRLFTSIYDELCNNVYTDKPWGDNG